MNEGGGKITWAQIWFFVLHTEQCPLDWGWSPQQLLQVTFEWCLQADHLYTLWPLDSSAFPSPTSTGHINRSTAAHHPEKKKSHWLMVKELNAMSFLYFDKLSHGFSGHCAPKKKLSPESSYPRKYPLQWNWHKSGNSVLHSHRGSKRSETHKGRQEYSEKHSVDNRTRIERFPIKYQKPEHNLLIFYH